MYLKTNELKLAQKERGSVNPDEGVRESGSGEAWTESRTSGARVLSFKQKVRPWYLHPGAILALVSALGMAVVVYLIRH